MSSLNTDIAAVVKMLGTGASAGAGKRSSAPNHASLKGEQGAFDMEMIMANKLLAEPDGDNEFTAQGMEMGVMNNLLMLEALTALNAVKAQSGAGGLRPQLPVNYHQSSRTSGVDGKRMSGTTVSGNLSARFESGDRGGAAIGYDRVGGTSYGRYQIASRTGTMDSFIKFLKDKAPEIADKLLEAGPADTGSKSGQMPEIWKEIAADKPDEFEKLQHDFIQKSHYDPAVKKIFEMTGVDMNSMPGPLREVLWSTSVQHGATGASRLIAEAIDKLASSAENKGFPADLVREIYGERQNRFSSSSSAVQKSVASRFRQEQNMALAMLGEGISKTA